MILKLDLQTGFDQWDLLTVIVALWLLWPLTRPPGRVAKFHQLSERKQEAS